jgi:prepilin-type N-terminal cleavage/methylation domain-containing protein
MVNRAVKEKTRISTVGKVTNRGYTLIELSVVMLLVGILLMISAPRIRDTLLNDDLKVATRRFVGAARELRNESVRERTDSILHIDFNGPALWSTTADTTAERRAELRKKAVRLPEGIRIVDIRQANAAKKTEGEAVIRFFRKGYATPTVIRLAKGDRTFSLVFHPFIQAVSVYESDVDFSFTQEKRGAGF